MASKGQKLKQWTKEEKLKLIKEVKKQEKSLVSHFEYFYNEKKY